ncbi:RNA-dependent RNA polymerase [Beihai weivirus-like virus 2]|uniref:RNA-dependent RNA polymerase n=1 Tax=Beihai weivirus-like virus 2 TaxID=1922748 RepID=UPI00090B6E00|nr:RNA-dependent RNA polymerase [Beihai weivirus-like virus 2]APG78091.1 RNA-dependent RNA polymerase [Beihai weivirus-like virus 2]
MLQTLPPSPLWARSLHPDCRRAAYDRPGFWEVCTHEPLEGTFLGRFQARLLGSCGYTTTSITLTEREFAKLMDVAKQHVMGRAKDQVLQAAVNIEANGLWRTGSIEHVGLKYLAPDMIIRVVKGSSTTVTTDVRVLLPTILSCMTLAFHQQGWGPWLMGMLRPQSASRPFWKPPVMLEMLTENVFREVPVKQPWVVVSLGRQAYGWLAGAWEDRPTMRTTVLLGLAGWVAWCGVRAYMDTTRCLVTTFYPKHTQARGSLSEQTPSSTSDGKKEKPDGGDTAPRTGQALAQPQPPATSGGAAGVSAAEGASQGEEQEPEGAQEVLDGGQNGEMPAPVGAPEELGPPAMLQQEQASTATRLEEAEDLVKQEDHGRYVVEEITGEKVLVALGQDFDRSQPRTRAPRVGVITGPSVKPPNIYSNSKDNVLAAIRERLEKKARACAFRKDDRQRIGRVIRKAIGFGGVFERKRIDEWFRKNFAIEEWRSKKWSDERIRNAIETLLCQVDPNFRLKTSVKLEDMPEGKAPRFLIADGDLGQVMALATIKCMEDLLFETFESHSIKHASKRDAMKRLLEHMVVPKKHRKDGYSFVEGDGSAWDTTCNAEVRSLIENPVITHIGACLAQTGLVPETWIKAHEKINEKATYNLYYKKFAEVLKKEIPAIRRSGHRGTSVLNWWINFVMWICSVFEEPERFLDPKVRAGKDVAGISRWFFAAFEGDDSGVETSPKLIELSEEDRKALREGLKSLADFTNPGMKITEAVVKASAEAIDFWERGGFNMKFVFPKKRATMVGCHLELDLAEDGSTMPTGLFMPELPRGVGKNVSCSPAIIEAVNKGDLKGVKRIAAAANLARAADFAGLAPTLSRKYKEYADSLEDGDFQDREMAMHVDGQEGLTAAAVRDRIDLLNGSVSPAEEEGMLARMSYHVQEGELTKFRNYPWQFENLMDHDGYFQSLPERWKIGGSL